MAAEPHRIDGPTPSGGAYALVFRHPDGSLEIAEYDSKGNQIARTYQGPGGER